MALKLENFLLIGTLKKHTKNFWQYETEDTEKDVVGTGYFKLAFHNPKTADLKAIKINDYIICTVKKVAATEDIWLRITDINTNDVVVSSLNQEIIDAAISIADTKYTTK